MTLLRLTVVISHLFSFPDSQPWTCPVELQIGGIGTAKRGLENRESRSHSIKEKVSRIEIRLYLI